MSNQEASDENSITSVSEKKVNKRRSSIFKRQSIVPPQDQDLENTNATEEISHESKKFKPLKDEETKFDIIKYIESLKKEDKKWREEYAKRKTRVHELTKREKIVQQTGQKLDITVLSDSERAFLATKPDYEEFNKNLFQLHAMATKVTFLNRYAENFYEKSTSKLQNDTEDAVHRIIDLTD
ncbi:uncharacterized protein LOC100119765 [Nasonia vitripennis]|uniref:Uncharacterized protein n=1 Tax=Nasonia vitripennis TaxID=7425 RepID=A0A7M7H960_NASVI|nr:uncharacterized protein LOC100119765 [Nasonia vitripennis]